MQQDWSVALTGSIDAMPAAAGHSSSSRQNRKLLKTLESSSGVASPASVRAHYQGCDMCHPITDGAVETARLLCQGVNIP
jgi:hypothetical protein